MVKNQFLTANFLLSNTVAEELYHETAKHLPIIDYHNHLPPKDIANNRTFDNLTEIWLDGDHYKWRAMRANGVAEQFITGKATPYEKFEKWAETVPYTLRNPLYHWTHLELKYPFGINELLNKQTARSIYERCSDQLQNNADLRVVNLLQNYKVESLCTTDDPADSLKFHKEIEKNDQIHFKVLPTFRPDGFLKADDLSYLNDYFEKIENLNQLEIKSFQSLKDSIENRHDYFSKQGCKLFDLALSQMPTEEASDSELEKIMSKILTFKALDPLELDKYRSSIIYFIAELNAKKGWTQQFHIGALRNNNSSLLATLGPDIGCDSMDDQNQARSMAVFFDRLKSKDLLAKTVLYNLNPKDNAVFSTMLGNFTNDSEAGQLQFGSGWWFLDQKSGIIDQLNTVSNHGLLRRFIGMLTDSRSFLSYSRHEYFRRILCDLIGRDVVNGELPFEMELLSELVSEICYYNAKNLLKL